METLGYRGVFVLSLLASGGMVFPILGLAAVCGVAGLGLNLILVGFIGGVGETIGEISGYCIGFGGQGAFTNRRFYKRAKGWMEHYGIGVILFLSIIPNPIFDFMGIAAGALRYPLGKFLFVG